MAVKTDRGSSISIAGCLVIPTAATRWRQITEGSIGLQKAAKPRPQLPAGAARHDHAVGEVGAHRDIGYPSCATPGARSLILVAIVTWRPGFVKPCCIV